MRIWISLLMAMALASVLPAQGRPDPGIQKAAMQKLAFLEGTWIGEAAVTRGNSAPIIVQQTEVVEFRLDGMLLLIEGTGRDTEGKIAFRAMAIVSYDQPSGTYRIRAWNAGNFVETEFKVGEKTFEWGFESGPATIQNRMRVDAEGRWLEDSDVTLTDGRKVQRTQMTLTHQGGR